MICTEDQFRSILREEAADITPDSVPPLRLPDRQLADPGRGRGRGSGTRWRRVLVPLGAAAAVTGIAVAATIVGGGSRAARPDAAPANLWSGVPAYYYVITSAAQPSRTELVVRDTRTGAVLATARSPKSCQFVQASAAASDRTTALACQINHKDAARLYLARFDPGGNRLAVTALSIPAIPRFWGLALSQDGSRIAAASVNLDLQATSSVLQIYSIRGRALRAWNCAGEITGWDTSGFYIVGMPGGLSWGPGATLAVNIAKLTANDTYAGGTRLLDTDRPSGSLLAASRPAVAYVQPGGYLLVDMALSGNGAELATLLARNHDNKNVFEFAVFAARTGRMLRHWERTADLGEDVLWAGANGTKLIAVASAHPGARRTALGVMSGERFTPLRRAPSSWTSIAF
jgi:hypothetical protein